MMQLPLCLPPSYCPPLQTVVDSWPNYSPKQQSILCFVAEQIVSTGDWQCLSAALRDALLLIQSV